MTDLLSGIGIEHVTLLIIIATLVIFLLDRIPIALTALISSIVLALVGAMDFKQVYSGFATPVTLLVFGMLIVGYALFETGAITILGKKILKSRVARNERALLGVLMLVAGIASAFLSNTALMATFIPLVGGMVATASGHLTNKNLLMPLGMAASVGGTITLVGSTSQPVASGIMSESGYGELGMFDFAPIAIPMLLVLILYMMTIGYNMERKFFKFEDHSTVGADDAEGSLDVKVTWKTWVATLTLVFCVISFMFGLLPIEITALIGAAIVLATGCIDFKTAMAQLDWNTVLLIAFAQGIAAGMNDSGAGKLVGEWSVAIVGESPAVLLAIAVVVTVVLTNIMSNTAVAAMMVPIFVSIAVGVGYHPFVFVLAIAIASNASIATPIGGTAMSQTLVAGYGFRDYLKLGAPITIVLTIMIAVITPLVFGFPQL
ncbi:SLC13 family permease [Corynebacterium ammoniagenes]|uniref:Transporter, DASS family n=1 Tax=Corynebacterium ammoniagenes DSM 20306 TaxID=649754 RepID=A0ABN0ADC6_CORAM|nr:SLC13 family permease [Corynebacterium ammoniagenes]APT82817.1 cation transporter [Corynebacterium ammoniagenes DSM 20306]AQS73868.1 cation transporter [Corynebacterium ammoniagenes]EFG80758.1 transporter, DASS family [Corynebacterium ammoniagenes DSM 20306]